MTAQAAIPGLGPGHLPSCAAVPLHGPGRGVFVFKGFRDIPQDQEGGKVA